MTNPNVQRVQDLRRSNAAQPIPGKRQEPTVTQEEADWDHNIHFAPSLGDYTGGEDDQ